MTPICASCSVKMDRGRLVDASPALVDGDAEGRFAHSKPELRTFVCSDGPSLPTGRWRMPSVISGGSSANEARLPRVGPQSGPRPHSLTWSPSVLAQWATCAGMAAALGSADSVVRSAAAGVRRDTAAACVRVAYLPSALSAMSGWRYAQPDAAAACLPVSLGACGDAVRVAAGCAGVCCGASTLRGRMGMAVFVSAWEQL